MFALRATTGTGTVPTATVARSGIAAMLATLSASSMLAQPTIGRLADRIGSRAVAAGGAVVAAGLLSLLGVVGHVALLYGLLVVGGLRSAAFHPAAAAAARRVLPERSSLAVSIFSAGGMVGMALGPMAVLLLIAHAGAGFTPLLMIPGVGLGLVLWRILPEATPPPSVHVDGHVRAGLVRGPVGRRSPPPEAGCSRRGLRPGSARRGSVADRSRSRRSP